MRGQGEALAFGQFRVNAQCTPNLRLLLDAEEAVNRTAETERGDPRLATELVRRMRAELLNPE